MIGRRLHVAQLAACSPRPQCKQARHHQRDACVACVRRCAQNYSDVRYYPWTPVECESYECLNKLRHAELIADIPTVTGILRRKLPQVLQGVPVSELKEPWPEAV